MKLNGTLQLLVYADNVNMLGGSIHTIRKNIDALVVASMQIGLEVNAEKTKYMIMSLNHIARQNNNIQTGRKCFERVEQYKYLGKTLTIQNFIH